MAGIKDRSKRGVAYHVVRHQTDGVRAEKWIRCTARDPANCKRCTGRIEAQRVASDYHHPEPTPDAPLETTSITLEALWDKWMETHVGPKRAPNTEKFYRAQKDRVMLLADGPTTVVNTIRQIDGDDWINVLIAMGHPPARVNRSLRAAKAMFRRGVQWSLIDTHPLAYTEKLKEPPVDRGEVMHSPDVVDRVVQSAPKLRDAAIIRIAAYSGARVSEILGLTHDKVNLDAMTIRLDAQLALDGKTLSATKGYERRDVPVLDDGISTLTAWIEACPRTEGDWVFPDDHGGPIVYRKWAKTFDRIRRDAGVDVLFHELRHTFATIMIEAGASPRQIKEWLAHSTIETTYKHYAKHFEGRDDEVRQAANNLVRLSRKRTAR